MEKIKSCIDKLYELRDEMKRSLEQNDQVVEQQKELCELVKRSTTKHDFSKFVEETEKQNEQYDEHRKVLQMRLDCICGLINKHEDNMKNNVVSDLEENITWLLFGLGVSTIEDITDKTNC